MHGFIAFLIVFAWLAAVVWTAVDASGRDDCPAFLWALVVLIAGFLGFLLYLILGRD